MSNWLSEYSGEDQLQVDAVNAKGLAHQPTQIKKELNLRHGSSVLCLNPLYASIAQSLNNIHLLTQFTVPREGL